MKEKATSNGRFVWCKIIIIFLVLFMILLPSTGFAITYSFESIDGKYTARGINDNGDIVGASGVVGYDGYLLTGGSFYNVETLPVSSLVQAVHDINTSNNMTGWYDNNPDGVLGYRGVYDTGSNSYTSFDSFQYEHPTLGLRQTYAYGINDDGWIVGMCRYPKNPGDNEAQSHAFLLIGELFTIIDPPGYDAASAKGINDLGQIVGTYYDTGNSTWAGFLLDYGIPSYSSIIFSGSTETQLYDINNDGWIVGEYTDSSNVRHGFVRIDGVFTEMSFPDADFTIPYGINSDGWIVGQYWKDQTYTAFLAKPVSEAIPEPTTTLLIGFGLLGIAGFRRKLLR
ncbi:MAG: PEP-CTERM sorting domain-containing protein [Deltaproteobacteria bacterium]|nr:PEP-CTERM sorting domain-containing protein [Deltaproteobacteria bacterium]